MTANVRITVKYEDTKSFVRAADLVIKNANKAADELHDLLVAAGVQCLKGNSNWVNHLLKHDIRGQKREAMVAWVLSFLPVKTKSKRMINGQERVSEVQLRKGFADEKAADRLVTGSRHPYYKHHSETSGDKVAEKFMAKTQLQNFLSKLQSNLDKVSAEDMMAIAHKMKLEAANLETTAKIKALVHAEAEPAQVNA